jgi:hypothetical protein
VLVDDLLVPGGLRLGGARRRRDLGGLQLLHERRRDAHDLADRGHLRLERERRGCRGALVVAIHPGPAAPRDDLHTRALEEPADAAAETLALAHDDRIGTELLADLRQQLVEIGAAIGPRLVLRHGAHASTTPIVSTRIPGAISL